jgi:multidrug resistance efflux pump
MRCSHLPTFILADHTAIDHLLELRSFDGTTDAFWSTYGDLFHHVVSATSLSIWVLSPEREWNKILTSGNTAKHPIPNQIPPEGLARKNPTTSIWEALLPTGDQQQAIVCIDWEQTPSATLLTLTHSLLSIPKEQREHRQLPQSEPMDLILLLIEEIEKGKRFKATAHQLCKQLALALQCDRVVLSWRKGAYLQNVGLSDTPTVERKMDAVTDLDRAMEEVLDLDDEILLPSEGQQASMARQHQHLANTFQMPHLLTLPLREGRDIVAALHLQRKEKPFQDKEVVCLRLGCDRWINSLSQLRQKDRWWGAKLAHAARQTLSLLMGNQHTWKKVMAIFIFVGLAFIFTVPFPYRIEAPFVLKSSSQALVSAPFKGYIDQVHQIPGDVLKKGSPLMDLDKSELILQKAALEADALRYQSEAKRHRGSGEFGQMNIASAQLAQTQAELKIIQHRLKRSSILSPIDGVLVEGRHTERIGSPVEDGDNLFRIVKLTPLYAELTIPEQRIPYVTSESIGELRFTSQPNLEFSFQLHHVEPAAFEQEGIRTFLSKADFLQQASWWRPGMSGLAKIDAGEKNLAWIFFHDIIDHLRLRFWW